MQRELVERARRGDHDAFAALAGAAINRLDAAARLILRDPEQAKDAVQNALHRLLVRSCIDESRRGRRQRLDVELTELDRRSTADGSSTVADRDELERGFRRLDPEQRALVVLHHYLDLPLPEVAFALGIPLGTAKSRLHRSLALMRAALEADARPRAGMTEGLA
jgi:RNA polymerase sigma factor (sigma-70 family)